MLSNVTNNLNLQKSINEYNDTINLLNETIVRDVNKRRTVGIAEARLLSLVNQAVNNDMQWYMTNRQQIVQEINNLTALRNRLGKPRTADSNTAIMGLRDLASDQTLSASTLRWQVLKYSLLYGSTASIGAGGAAATVTGLSAFSFFGGPVIGGIVTGSVGGAGIVATGLAGAGGIAYGAYKGYFLKNFSQQLHA